MSNEEGDDNLVPSVVPEVVEEPPADEPPADEPADNVPPEYYMRVVRANERSKNRQDPARKRSKNRQDSDLVQYEGADEGADSIFERESSWCQNVDLNLTIKDDKKHITAKRVLRVLQQFPMSKEYKKVVQVNLSIGGSPIGFRMKKGNGKNQIFVMTNYCHSSNRDKFTDVYADLAKILDEKGKSAVHATVILRVLRASIAPETTIDNNGETPLYWAARNGHIECVQMLIEGKANVDIKNNNGETPLYWAARNGHIECVQMLIEGKANVDIKDNNGATALHMAAWKGQKECVQILIEGKANVDIKDNYGRTPLYRAALNGHKECVQILIEGKANVDIKNNNGETPLYWAARNGHKECVQILIEGKANVDIQDIDEETPLHGAALNGHKECVQILIEGKANVDIKDNNGATALHGAALNGHKECVQMLIKGKANVDIQDIDEETPLSLAANKECVQMLIEGKAVVNVIVHGFDGKIQRCMISLIALTHVAECVSGRTPGMDKFARGCLQLIADGKSTFAKQFSGDDAVYVPARRGGTALASDSVRDKVSVFGVAASDRESVDSMSCSSSDSEDTEEGAECNDKKLQN